MGAIKDAIDEEFNRLNKRIKELEEVEILLADYKERWAALTIEKSDYIKKVYDLTKENEVLKEKAVLMEQILKQWQTK